MKMFVKRGLLVGLTLALVMSVKFQVRGAAVHAQAAGVQSSPESQEKDKQETDENDAYRHSPMVVKLGGLMGMSAEQAAVIFEWVNFTVLAGVVVFALVKFIPKAFRDRSTAIQKRLVDARTATEEASARLNLVEARLGKLDVEIAAMRTQAERDSARDEARIKASVEDERQKILASAEQEIASATSQAHKALQQYAAELAIEQAARKLVVSAETDRLLVQSFAQRLAGDESKKGHN